MAISLAFALDIEVDYGVENNERFSIITIKKAHLDRAYKQAYLRNLSFSLFALRDYNPATHTSRDAFHIAKEFSEG